MADVVPAHYRGALLVISHDLALLDQAITRVLHLDEGELIEYRGTYSQYLVARKADEERRAKIATPPGVGDPAAEHARRLDAPPDRRSGPASRRRSTGASTSCGANRIELGKGERTLRVKLPDPPRAGRVVLEVVDLAKAFGPKVVFEDVSFEVGRGERLLVLGLNGAGKTTLLRSLVGELEPDLGEVAARPPGARWATTRRSTKASRPGRSVHRAHPRGRRARASSTSAGCSACSVCAARSRSRTRARSRAARRRSSRCAMLVAGRHNLLLLDEPTNNLDPPSRTAIGDALREWKGAMVLVSHDPEFVDRARARPRAADARRRRRLLVGRPPRPRRARLSPRPRRGYT